MKTINAKIFFSFMIIAASTIVIGISTNTLMFSSASSVSSHQKGIQKVQLSVNITNPVPKSTITSKVILVNGTTESVSRIQKVQLLVHTYPFSGVFDFREANPISEGDWSKWSISIPVNTTGIYRILSRFKDNME